MYQEQLLERLMKLMKMTGIERNLEVKWRHPLHKINLSIDHLREEIWIVVCMEKLGLLPKVGGKTIIWTLASIN